jgi:alpha-L-fucosidase
MQRRMIGVLLLWAGCAVAGPDAQPRDDARMQWFREAKFGLFIHWGLYAIPARGEWVMNKEKIPVANYGAFADRFNPVKFDADEWVRIAKDAGMRYIIITSKHHDGFAMFGSKVSPYNIVDATPFKRDPLKEFAAACRKQGIRLGFYYSQAQDWHHPGGAVARGSWDNAQLGDFDKYLDGVAIPQITELLTGYAPVAILWCDTPIQMDPARAARVVAAARAADPKTLINSRLLYSGRKLAEVTAGQLDELRRIGADYLSYADRQIPEHPQWRDWETCMTLNGSWGYNKNDDHWKSPDVLIGQLVEIASKGGNFLLNVGPTAEGTIPAPSIERLKAVGAWLKVNGEAIYGAGPSPFAAAEEGKAPAWRCTTRPFDGAQGKLYIHLLTWPSGTFSITGLKEKVAKAYLLADPQRQPLSITQDGGSLTVALPAAAPGEHINVLCLEGRP